MQIDSDARGRMVAPKNLMISEYEFEMNSCCPQTLGEPLFLWRGESMWTDNEGLVVERLDGRIVHHPLRHHRRNGDRRSRA
ncbi:hypothetical protein [Catellatospora sp. NPDC049133]|jgi:hypothetical protein|uniref:hypothetical protein n=1 Tax=Catellatospora sp. NPDC049133 TaxID=3155499 RepID=UPI0033D43695